MEILTRNVEIRKKINKKKSMNPIQPNSNLSVCQSIFPMLTKIQQVRSKNFFFLKKIIMKWDFFGWEYAPDNTMRIFFFFYLNEAVWLPLKIKKKKHCTPILPEHAESLRNR